MAKPIKQEFLAQLAARFGVVKRLNDSQSLFEIGNGAARVYVRYSKLHPRGQAFYGLRLSDLKALEGHPSVICFLWDGQAAPLMLPFSDYEQLFQGLTPAGDGQFKAQLYPQEQQGTELYVARAGRFNVEAFFGWSPLESLVDLSRCTRVPILSHPQVQTLLGAIGVHKGFDIWVPRNDRAKLDWSLTGEFQCCDLLPAGLESIRAVVQEIDVIWMHRGSGKPAALFEVEHSTSIYSGLLRFNDIHLSAPAFQPRFSIVADDVRRDAFVRQLNRPSFLRSGLNELCSFLEYANVFGWYQRLFKHEIESK